ncbi:MAG: hypothetical protein HOM21_04185, partial [Halobacteriovoraceae bacterium]|nr:hypothetical protein [Halobacteriovoraceae bacterium]
MKKFQILLLLLLGLILSEGFLQLVSAVVIYRSDRPQTFNLQKNDEIRILCLGESTTALGGKDSYPRQLERILQERLRSKTIKVINLGSPNFHTDKILEKIPLWLEEYRPQIVISMMGINDFWNSSRSHHLFSAGLRKIKILKLIDFAYINWTFRERNALVENGEENYGPFIVNPVYPQKIDRAVKLAKEKNWKMAKVLLNKVIVKTANRVAVATEIWNLYEDPKNTELLDLIEDLLRETKLEKDALAEANRLRGMIEIKNGDTEKAVLFFRQAHQQGLLNPAFLDQYAN